MSDLKECFEVLGLPHGASKTEIKQAYRDLVKVWHPDRFGDEDPRLRQKAEQKLKEINRAYEILRKAEPLDRTASDSRDSNPRDRQRDSTGEGHNTSGPTESRKRRPTSGYSSEPRSATRQSRPPRTRRLRTWGLVLAAGLVCFVALRFPHSRRLDVEQLNNARYDCEPGLGTFTLKDGAFEAEFDRLGIARVSEAERMVAFGDLDADGFDDAAVGIFYDAGGSGTWVFLYAMLDDGGVPKCAAAVQLGDRPHVRGLSIEDGKILLDVNLRTDGDGMAQASVPVRATYKLTGDKLVSKGIPNNVELFDIALDPKSPLVGAARR